MAERFSTGLRDFLLGEGCFRKAFEDAVIKIYSGTAPATADDAVTGTLLLTVTKSSGTVSAGEDSVGKIHHITIIDDHDAGDTYAVNVTVDGVGPTTHTYTNTPDAGTAAQVMIEIAEMINEIPQLMCIPDVTARESYVMSRILGLDFTLADGGGTNTITVDAAVQAASRSDAISFGKPASGVISKATAETWSGQAAATGTAGYFRVVTSSDDGSLSTTQVRFQGVVATSGGELDVATVSITSGATYTIDSYSFTFPAE